MLTVSCKIPEEEQDKPKKDDNGPAKTIDGPDKPAVPYTSKITYDLWAEKDADKPSIIHITAKPVVDEELLADHPGGRLEVEVYPGRGLKLIKGKHRYRVFLRDLANTEINLDIRKDTFGVSDVEFKGEILARNGTPLIQGDAKFKVLAHPGEKVILDQEKIQQYLEEKKQQQ
jgi:hypothetical protein